MPSSSSSSSSSQRPDPSAIATHADNEDDEAGYVSAEDEDFAPDDAAEGRGEGEGKGEGEHGSSGSEDSDDEEDGEGQRRRKKERASGTGTVVKGAAGRSKNGIAEAEAEIEREEVEALMEDAGKSRKRKRKGSTGGAGDEQEEEDSGGEGGFVKTRSMAAARKEEAARKPLASATGADVDVDALWQSMNDTSLKPETPATAAETGTLSATSILPSANPQDPSSSSSTDLVPVTETYKFAGETHTTTRLVPRSSLADKDRDRNHGSATQAVEDDSTLLSPDTATATTTQKLSPTTGLPLLRPLRRISPFDPNPTASIRGLATTIMTTTTTTTGTATPSTALVQPLNNSSTTTTTNPLTTSTSNNTTTAHPSSFPALSSSSPYPSSITTKITYTLSKSDARSKKGAAGASRHRYNIPRVRQPAKLNVVDKSKLDWQAHVQATPGAAEELVAASRAKGDFLARRDFLERVEGRTGG